MRPRTSTVVGATLAAALGAGLVPAAATAAPARQHTWTVAAPGAAGEGGITARVDHDPADGTLSLRATRDGERVLSGTLGVRTADADLTEGLRRAGAPRTRVVEEQYRMTTGKQRARTATMTETRLPFASANGTRLDLVVRAADDGVAYRYVLPDSETVTGEASAFELPADAPAWLQPYNPQHENQRFEGTAGQAPGGEYGNPSLFETPGGYALLTEADVDGDYSGARLSHREGTGSYHVTLDDDRVDLGPDRDTPWRTAVVGDLATVTESTLVDDLAGDTRIADTSWIRPGKVAWSWLSEHASPSDFARQKDYVDFAARNGWSYVLVDEGWSAEWVPELTRYARSKGVDVLLWFHWTDLRTQQQRDEMLPRVTSWGVKGVKVDFMESDSQERFRWYDDILADTARHELMINFHGSTIPHGLARTWPHLMTMEAVHGQEQLSGPGSHAVHPFTRNVVGSMDFTPVALSVGPRETSVAHEAALSVLYESGWQHFADKPEAYEEYPGVLRLLNQVPASWDETRLVSGDPRDHAVMARRHGDRWFLGGIATGERETLRVPLDFLRPGRWLVDVVRDGDAPVSGDVRRTHSVRRSGDTLSIDVARNGGFAAIVCRARAGRTSCDEPVTRAPETTMTVTPEDAGDTPSGTSVRVEATVTMDSDRTARDLVLRPRAPEGWTVSGRPVTEHKLRQGESVSGRWTITAGPDTPSGNTEIPVVAEFRDRQSGAMHVSRAVDAFVPPPEPTGETYVSDLPFQSESNGWGPVERDRSNGDSAAGDGSVLTIDGTTFEKGLGVHAPSEVSVYLGGNCTTLSASVGLDDETDEPGSVSFEVLADGRSRYESGVVTGTDPAVPVSADVTGARMVTLRVTDGGDGKNFDHADWADATVHCRG